MKHIRVVLIPILFGWQADNNLDQRERRLHHDGVFLHKPITATKKEKRIAYEDEKSLFEDDMHGALPCHSHLLGLRYTDGYC